MEVIEGFDPHLVLLDIDMPHGSGIEVCRQIKKRDGKDGFTPVLLITGYAQQGLRSQGFEAGADDCLDKPVELGVLRTRVRSLLRSRALHGRVVDLRTEVSALRNELVHRSMDEHVAPERVEVTILFSDIRRFTQISDQLDPEEVTSVVDRYLREMSDVVVKSGGSLNKVMGDGLLVLFRDDVGDHRFSGIECALRMRDVAGHLSARMHATLPEDFTIGIGVHTGEVILGTIGDGLHSEYTALGSAVNLAARLQGLATSGQVIASRATYGPLENRLDVRGERRQSLKGFAHPVRIAEIAEMR